MNLGNKKARIIGKAVGDIAQMFVGAGEAKAALKATKVTKVLAETETVAKVTKAVEATGEVAAAATKASTTGVNRIYSARELIRRGAEPGPFHNFPESFNKTIFQNGTRAITPNYYNVAKPGLSNTNILYKYPGTVNGTQGFFEIGVRPSLSGRTEVIMHRFFNPIR